MKNLILLLVLFTTITTANSQSTNLNYTVDLNNISNDTFKVILDINQLSNDNNIYQFASTAPGTYSTMDLGRFVSDFKAFTKKGKEVATIKISDNQYSISKAKKVKKISYQVAETFDTKTDNRVLEMAGTSIEKDHVFINPHCIIGYPLGMQGSPLNIKLNYPKDWLLGTALSKNKSGSYSCNTFDHAVDSPILLGRLSKATTNLNGTDIDIYVYSKTDLIKAEQLLASMREMLNAATDFVVDFPVDRYTFLYHFEDIGVGAWEHSYSSAYVMPEMEFTDEYSKQITDMAGHEFFHIITPLNIHSELVVPFDFVEPKASEHLWLYEGTTEWASHIMQLRYGSFPLETYLSVLTRKLNLDDRFDKDYSLSELSLNSFSEQGQSQYVNIYMRGALVAGLLDIKLLELSKGKRGLREVINELSKTYGPEKAFDEATFFDTFTKMTYPEIGDFFKQYVRKAEPLPIKEYYGKMGINYQEEVRSGEKVGSIGGQIGVPDGKLRFMNVGPKLAAFGIQDGDEIVALNDTPISLQNAHKELSVLGQLAIDEAYAVTIIRDDEEKKVDCKIIAEEDVQKHVFTIDEESSKDQKYLRNQWMKNL